MLDNNNRNYSIFSYKDHSIAYNVQQNQINSLKTTLIKGLGNRTEMKRDRGVEDNIDFIDNEKD